MPFILGGAENQKQDKSAGSSENQIKIHLYFVPSLKFFYSSKHNTSSLKRKIFGPRCVLFPIFESGAAVPVSRAVVYF